MTPLSSQPAAWSLTLAGPAPSEVWDAYMIPSSPISTAVRPSTDSTVFHRHRIGIAGLVAVGSEYAGGAVGVVPDGVEVALAAVRLTALQYDV